MRVLIIEDEMGALDDLRSILAESAPDIRIAGTTESVMQSVAWLEKNPAPDLIFMDIHLSDGSAFEIFKRTAVEAPVIFTTAYDEYAIHAFRVNAVDYLLKPLAIDEVKRALEKYRKLSRPQVLPDIEKLYEMISCQRTNSRRNILVAYKDKLLPIPTEKIAFSIRPRRRRGYTSPMAATMPTTGRWRASATTWIPGHSAGSTNNTSSPGSTSQASSYGRTAACWFRWIPRRPSPYS